NRRMYVRRFRAKIIRRTRMTNGRWFLALGVWLLMVLGTPGSAIAQTVSTGQPIDLSPDAEDFQIWYTIGAEGWAVSSEDVELGGSSGQAITGSPNALADT